MRISSLFKWKVWKNWFLQSPMSSVLPDKTYIKMRFKLKLGRSIDLGNPQTMNEKLQWLKLYNRKPEYTMMADKYAVREYISQLLGEEYLIPLLGVWDNPEEIDFDALPNEFVLKCNHNSGLGMCICKDKSKLDISKVKKDLKKGLQENYYLAGREWPYKNIKRRIIAEKYMTDGGKELMDFKVHNFNGEPRFILVCRDRFSQAGLTEDFFTTNWWHMPIKRPETPNASYEIPKPEQLKQILELSKKLAVDIPFARTDFYIIDGNIYFGEITFFPSSGFKPFIPQEWDYTLGSWIKLPTKEQSK